MRKIAAIIVVLVFLFSGCGTNQTDAAESSQPTENLTAQSIIIEENLPSELTNLDIFKKAVEKNAVICYQNEVITAGSYVKSFAEKFKNNEPCELWYYSFTDMGAGHDDPRGIYFFHIVNDGKEKPYYQVNYVADWDEEPLFDEYKYSVSDLEVNKYGFITFNSDSSSEVLGNSVISDKELYSDYEQRKFAYDKYIAPLLYDLGASFEFSNISEITNWICLFNDIYAYLDPDNNDGNMWATYPNGIPAALVMDMLSRYFDVSKDDVVKSTKYAEYDKEKDTFLYEGGRGGAMPLIRVLEYLENGNKAQIKYQLCDFITGEPYKQNSELVMTVRLLDDGSFRYLSNLTEK